MSAPPGTTQPAPGNLNTYVLGGAIAGIVVLCAGLLTSSLITLNIVTRHADYAFRPGATQPRGTDRQPDTRPDGGTIPIDDEDRGPLMAAQAFMADIKERRFDKAWNRGTSPFKTDESAKQFRQRLEADKVFLQHNTYKVTRVEEATKPGLSRYDVFFRGPGGEGHYNLEVRQEDNTWRIDSFAKD